jgi:hypothetical protein
MTDSSTQASDPLRDRAQVRIFTLADYVADESSGKLYISGAGLEWTGLPTRDNKIAPCHLVIRLAFPRPSARPMHTITVRVVDDAGSPVGPDPLLRAEMKFDLHRVPDYFTEVSGNLAVEIADYPISVDVADVVFFHLLVDDLVVSRLPVQLSFADT